MILVVKIEHFLRQNGNEIEAGACHQKLVYLFKKRWRDWGSSPKNLHFPPLIGDENKSRRQKKGSLAQN
jgi:hypothetical protein